MGQEKHITGKRKWKQLSERERFKIEDLSQEGLIPLEIATRLGRDRRTIEREIVRGSVMQRRENPYASRNPNVPDYLDEKRYCADAGQRVHLERASNKGPSLKIGHDHKLVAHIEQKIKDERYSPDAVIGEIKAQKQQFAVSICTKTLYNYIDRGLFLNISNKDLPVKKSKKRSYHSVRRVALNNRKGRSIEERPAGIESREDYGHWEMDCVVGKRKACLLVLTERKAREERIFKMPGKTQENVIAVLDALERKYKKKFTAIFKSITMDNGSEFLDMAKLEASCLRPGQKRTICYYAHPYSSWERGSNENANKLIRRFVPKGTDISKLSKTEVKCIERWMNNYPRRIFGYKSANQMKAA